MARSLFLKLALLLAFSLPGAAQSHFARGEVVVAGYRDVVVDVDGNTLEYVSNLRVHNLNGTFVRQLATSTTRVFREPLVMNDTAFVPTRTPEAIARFVASGTELAPFTTEVTGVNYLSPGPNGGIIAANVSGEIYVFAADGTLTAFRDFTQTPPAHGIDLASDGCTLFYTEAGAIARWDICRNTPATFLAPPFAQSSSAFRILPGGTFLVAANLPEGARVLHVAGDGSTIIRTYPIPANALALDIDGTSFWTNAGNFLLKVDIATGNVLSETYTDFLIEGISVVGEPRAAFAAAANVPAISAPALITLMLTVAVIAMLRLRAV